MAIHGSRSRITAVVNVTLLAGYCRYDGLPARQAIPPSCRPPLQPTHLQLPSPRSVPDKPLLPFAPSCHNGCSFAVRTTPDPESSEEQCAHGLDRGEVRRSRPLCSDTQGDDGLRRRMFLLVILERWRWWDLNPRLRPCE
jgi:hypothetical protein